MQKKNEKVVLKIKNKNGLLSIPQKKTSTNRKVIFFTLPKQSLIQMFPFRLCRDGNII
jgi:hypothetical protein